jgi:cellobiose phosphorylase
MYEDGGVRHWWHPGFDIFVESHHSDTCLWLAYGLLAYLDETNDLSCLFEIYRYLKRDTQQFGAKGSLFEHAMRGIERALSRISPRGLPLIGAGDWNDGLSHAGIDGRGESAWLAMFLYDILQRWRPILEELGENARAEQFGTAAADLQRAVNEHAWDGEWFLAGTRDDGLPFGSRLCHEGRLFLNPQTWAVLSGIATPERAAQALEAVSRHLVKPYGALLLTPAYSSPDPYIGYITRYAPGLRENGGVYMHASTWAVQAFAMIGDHDRAYEVYKSMCPPDRAQNADEYCAEPYVMPGNVDGPDSPHEGRAGWTWYTGSAAWMHRVALDWICGVRATREGLVIEASGPWPEYVVTRKFRGDTYRISVEGTGSEFTLSVDEHDHVGPLNGPGAGLTFDVRVRRF